MTQPFDLNRSLAQSLSPSSNGLQSAVTPDPTQTFFPAVNTISIAGNIMPGMWVLQDATREFGWQIQKAAFLSGATLLPVGDDPLIAKFLVSIWRSIDMALFKELQKTLLRKPVYVVGGTVSTKAFEIAHPALLALGCKNFVVKSVSAMVNDGTGLWTCTVEFLEWRKPVQAVAKASTVIPDDPPPQPTAQDGQDIEIQRLHAEVKGIAARTLRQ
jgi:hypothetical protein